MTKSAPGKLFIISAASGTGKTTLVTALVKDMPGVIHSISTTTRAKRDGEVHGVHYNFVSVDEFKAMVARHAFYEHAEVHGNFYGTSREWVEARLAEGQDVILEIDWQGAAQMRKLMPACVTVFILPPSIAALESRLRGRGKDSEEVIQRRLAAAKGEIAHAPEYDYLIINDDLNQALTELKAVFLAERCQTAVQQQRHAQQMKALLS
ncbi:guanylate kinase [Permianibacter sp. IMCC34836]|uniref:guanylate kinase n=1 Tax=Permianibacter fluminis TaxID=2738515 RepID=UPI001551D4E1|nr:guanylate kinase [Permianibacter fluminis]NQD36475.1 guanylate kinase [Permianibacter fluminis]